MKSTMDTVIENLIDATLGDEAEGRARHVLREALRGLVRLAKSEQMLDIRTSVTKLTATAPYVVASRKVKVTESGKDNDRQGSQCQLEFNPLNMPHSNADRNRDRTT